MKVAAIQFCPKHSSPDENLRSIEQYLRSTEADLIVFPELSTTGYCFQSFDETRALALPLSSERFNALQSLCDEQKKTVALGFIECEGDKVYNSCLILIPGIQQRHVYRKTHLFYKERYCFHEGNTGFKVFDDPQHGLRVGVMICYDWRFPESARSLALQSADIIVCPSNLVTHIWPKVMPARAIENKVYLIVANRWGAEQLAGEEIRFNGLSAIYSYNGEALVSSPAEGDSCIIAEVDPELTRNKSFNAENDILQDRRPQYYL